MPKRLLANSAEIKFFSVLGVVLLALLILSFVMSKQIHRGTVSSPAKVVTAPNPFDTITLTAKAAYILDVNTGKVLFEKKADTRMPLASLTKVMTALVASELAPGYSTVVVTREAVETEGDSGLEAGESWSLKNLLDFSLISSSNDGVRAVGFALGALSDENATSADSEADFVRLMNVKADTLGMKNTYYSNDTGLDLPAEQSSGTAAKSGAYGTAQDQALLFAYILKNHPTLMEATRAPVARIASLDRITHIVHNTDTLVSEIPRVLASKTGYTDLAGGNLVVAFDPELGRPIIVSVLGSTQEGRFADMQKLVSASLQYISEGRE